MSEKDFFVRFRQRRITFCLFCMRYNIVVTHEHRENTACAVHFGKNNAIFDRLLSIHLE